MPAHPSAIARAHIATALRELRESIDLTRSARDLIDRALAASGADENASQTLNDADRAATHLERALTDLEAVFAEL
jgi:hypothetical protein